MRYAGHDVTGRCAVSEPDAAWQWSGESLERSPEEVLASLRPLPPADEMLIEDLTEEEDRLFMAAVLDA